MGVKVRLSVIFIVLVLGAMQMKVIAGKDKDGKELLPPPPASNPEVSKVEDDREKSSESDPELTVEELCAKDSDKSSCVKNFGPLANKDTKKAKLSYYIDEGAKMARTELTKAYKVSDSLKPKAQQSPDPRLTNDCLEGCKHYIDLALDRLGGQSVGEGEGEGGAPSPAPANGGDDSSGDSEPNLFFSDAHTFTTTCLDELELANVPDMLKTTQEALDKPRELIGNLLGISHVLEAEPDFPPLILPNN